MATKKSSKGMKEVRGGNLILTIKEKLPNVGHVKLDTNGRKAFFSWRNFDFVISSRLMIKQLGLFDHASDTDTSTMLQARVRA